MLGILAALSSSRLCPVSFFAFGFCSQPLEPSGQNGRNGRNGFTFRVAHVKRNGTGFRLKDQSLNGTERLPFVLTVPRTEWDAHLEKVPIYLTFYYNNPPSSRINALPTREIAVALSQKTKVLSVVADAPFLLAVLTLRERCAPEPATQHQLIISG